jgi:hypothetical protein
MAMTGRIWTIGAGAAALAGMTLAGMAGATAQEPEERGLFGNNAEATVYRDAGYNGPAVTATRAEPNMGLSWRVQSVRVRSGRWELCEEPVYRGDCWTVDRDTPLFGPAFKGRRVLSMRPIGGNGGSGGNWGNPEPGRNPSLRGMASEFYPAPAQRGYRVLACPTGSATANCAERTANQFCTAMGWRRSARQTLETVRQRVYLADVLCTNAY